MSVTKNCTCLWLRWMFGAVVLAFAWCPAGYSAEPLLMPGKKTLYQRVLTRPGAKLVAQPGEADGKPLPALSRLYVYERKPVQDKEWLLVGGDSRGKTGGWLDATQSILWKQQIVLAFANPANRPRTLLFEKRDTVMELLQAPDAGARAAEMVAAAEAGKSDPRVVSIEPKEYIDITKQFYLLPILQAEMPATKHANVVVLEVASVTARGDSPAMQHQTPATPAVLRTFSSAVVFVIDATISMGPYIDRTREAVRRIYDTIEKAGLANQVKFGLVAFRSSTDAVPALEYVSKVFVNPSEVKSGQDFLEKVASLQPAKVSSARFDEDSYAGVMSALETVPWKEFGGRYVVLITDAGAIEGGDALSSTKLGAKQVRIEAEQLGVALHTLHLKTPAGKRNHASAKQQYETLTKNDRTGKELSLYYAVDSGAVDQFGQIVDALAATLVQHVQGAARGEMVPGSARTAKAQATPPAGKAEDVIARMQSDAQLVGRAMQLAYLGQLQGTRAPDLFNAWLSDRDFGDPTAAKPVEVRVLLTKNELSNLGAAVQAILEAGEKSQETVGTADFYDLLRESAARLLRGTKVRTHIEKQDTLAVSGLLDEYLEDLPYKSPILNLTPEEWEQYSPGQQDAVLDGLRRNLSHYRIYNEDTGRWILLDGTEDPGEAVYPVPIDALP